MGLITRPYTSTISGTQIIFPSNIARAFDDVYNLINGGIDSANLAGSASIEDSQIATSASTLSAANLGDGFLELRIKGHNTIHAIGLSACGIRFFSGVIEVNGTICKLASAIKVGSSGVVFSDGRPHPNFLPFGQALHSSGVYAFTVNETINLTVSDFRPCLLSDISASNGINIDKNGFYYCATRRVVCTAKNLGAGNQYGAYGTIQYIQAPSNFEMRKLTQYEACQNGFLTFAAASAANVQHVCQVIRFFDFETNGYGYEAQGQLAPVGTETTLIRCNYGSSCSPNTVAFFISDAKNSASRTLATTRKTIFLDDFSESSVLYIQVSSSNITFVKNDGPKSSDKQFYARVVPPINVSGLI